MSAAVRIGTSGWEYADWRGAFYPEEVPKKSWLEWYARHFTTVEANGTFYRLPERETFESWRSRTPEHFEIALKASRYLTHVRRLREPRPAVERLLERASGLGERLGPILLQLPPNFGLDLARLEETLSSFPEGVRVAVEFRHESWLIPETEALLRHFGAATCLADRAGPLAPMWRTAPWGYARFHGGVTRPIPRYGLGALRSWASRLDAMFGDGETVYAYFNNDHLACAPRNAREFAGLCRKVGLTALLGEDEPTPGATKRPTRRLAKAAPRRPGTAVSSMGERRRASG